ncbi:MAG: glycosyltransferase [Rhodoferax sp.]|nr:glycosyltransferase [Rhodoferax sp.]
MFALDTTIFLWINATGATPERLLALASFASQELPQWVLAGMIGALVMADTNRRGSVWRILLAMAFAWTLTKIGQPLFQMPRPFVMGLGTAWLPHGGGAGFPSAHASVAFAFAAAVVMTSRSWLLGMGAVGVAALIAWSRVSLGLHFPSDVFAGVLLGWACAWLVCRFRFARPNPVPRVVPTAIAPQPASHSLADNAFQQRQTTITAPRIRHPFISCVVPAFNEEANLQPLLLGLTAQLATLSERWEVIVVDDGSQDGTAHALAPWLTRPGVRYLQLSRNFGKEAALTAGIDHAGGDVVVLMDADLQHPVALIARMLDSWQQGADMVCAARHARSDESLAKRLGTAIFYSIVNRNPATAMPVDAGDFRLMDRRVVDVLKSLPERNRFMKGLYAWVGFHTVVIPYTPGPRLSGRSSFSLRSLARLAFTGVTAFSNAPLRWWSGVGVVIAALALAYGTWIVVEYFIFGVQEPGWATVAAGVMFLSGVQLLSIGILGEYVGRIFDEVKQRPIYVVQMQGGRSNGTTTRETQASALEAV